MSKKDISVKTFDWKSGHRALESMKKEDPDKHYILLRKRKMEKRIRALTNNHHIFQNNIVELDIANVKFSRYDYKKGVSLPTSITPELAEEIGMHIGDGTLPVKKIQFFVTR
jgi:hypothetical protein